MDIEESPEEEASETPQQEASENVPVQYVGGIFVLATPHHRNMFDHKNQHKKKHGY